MTGRRDDERSEAIRLPDGARDVLPVERSEVAAIEAALRAAFGSFGYREVRTPLLEYADVMDRAQEGGIRRAFRLFDDHGEVLVVRPDLTIPVARLVAARFASHPGPLRVSYVGDVLRPVPPGKAHRLEERQAGLELVGTPGAAADAEIIGLLVTAIRALGVTDLSVGLSDVSLTRAVLDGVGVGAADQECLRDATRARNLVGWRRIAASLDLPSASRELVAGLPMRRGGPELLREIAVAVPAAADACSRLEDTLAVLRAHDAADGVMVDLGVLRDWGYYSGVVFEVYAPGIGRPIGIGGRYDELIGRFGEPRGAVGAAILLDRLHEALAARNGVSSLADGVVLAGGLDSEVAQARALRAAGIAVAGTAMDPGVAEALAAADGWRFVARPGDGGFVVTDRTTDRSVACRDVEEGLRSLRS